VQNSSLLRASVAFLIIHILINIAFRGTLEGFRSSRQGFQSERRKETSHTIPPVLTRSAKEVVRMAHSDQHCTHLLDRIPLFFRMVRRLARNSTSGWPEGILVPKGLEHGVGPSGRPFRPLAFIAPTAGAAVRLVVLQIM
jgi:hypothetical protein